MSSKSSAETQDADPQQGTVVPRLRFPEFRDAGGWKRTTIGNLCESFSGGTPATTNKSYYGGSIPFIRSAEINSHTTELYLTDDGVRFSSAKKVVKGDILIALYGANSGDVAISKINGVINQAILCLRYRGNNVFLYSYFFARKNWIVSTYIQGGQGNLSAEIIKSVPFIYPDTPEQQKIADCLSTLDETISTVTRKLEMLKAHKKGLMQKIFTREEETTPRLRFPEFRDAEEWEKKSLHSVVKSVKTGKLDANAMVRNGKYRFYTCAKDFYHIDHYAFDGEALLVSGNGAYLGYIHHYIGKFNAYQRTYVLQEFSANAIFLKYLLDHFLPSRIFLEKKDGNTPYIVLSTITEMELIIPCIDEEQQKIADCLSTLDEAISAVSRKLEVLKAHKKGLMQQLFPNMTQVNG